MLGNSLGEELGVERTCRARWLLSARSALVGQIIMHNVRGGISKTRNVRRRARVSWISSTYVTRTSPTWRKRGRGIGTVACIDLSNTVISIGKNWLIDLKLCTMPV